MRIALQFAQEHWFKLIVILILWMCYIRLGEISDRTFQVTDVLDAKLNDVTFTLLDSLEPLQNIESNTANIYYAVQ